MIVCAKNKEMNSKKKKKCPKIVHLSRTIAVPCSLVDKTNHYAVCLKQNELFNFRFSLETTLYG